MRRVLPEPTKIKGTEGEGEQGDVGGDDDSLYCTSDTAVTAIVGASRRSIIVRGTRRPPLVYSSLSFPCLIFFSPSPYFIFFFSLINEGIIYYSYIFDDTVLSPKSHVILFKRIAR